MDEINRARYNGIQKQGHSGHVEKMTETHRVFWTDADKIQDGR